MSDSRPCSVPATERILTNEEYRARLQSEIEFHKDYVDISALPSIHVYWAETYIRPLLREVGAASPDEFATNGLLTSAARCGAEISIFASLGSGNCDTEVRLARMLLDRGLQRFRLDCIDVNPDMLARGRALATQEGLSDYVVPLNGDLNDWRPDQIYHGIVANQVLHHVVGLEKLFQTMRRVLHSSGLIVANDMIGRNGHLRWPEALDPLQEFWKELPLSHRYNWQLNRLEVEYENWDCSQHGFEGIRSQDVLPLLVEYFDFEIFLAFGNVVDVFVDRCFGHNFDANHAADREFIDRVHAFDERGLEEGTLTPTHMIALLGKHAPSNPHFARGLSPRSAIRNPSQEGG